MKNLAKSPDVKKDESNSIKTPFRKTFVNTKGYGMKQIRNALRDLEKGIIVF